VAATAKVLIVDNDRDISELARALLTDEGYEVACLYEHGQNDVPAAVGRLEPDCVILDGESGWGGDYGSSWGEAADLRARGRMVPVIMFTAHAGASAEAEAGESERAQAAGFSSVIRKPFDVDELVDAVAKATGESAKFDASPAADLERSRSLAAKVEQLGARDVRASTRREWITFRAPDDSLFQLYWWQKGGCYYVGAYLGTGGRMENLGLFYDVDGAVACAELALKTHAAPV
jgi:CheY-like chemotaxis protein